jgi:hypothetical protein
MRYGAVGHALASSSGKSGSRTPGSGFGVPAQPIPSRSPGRSNLEGRGAVGSPAAYWLTLADESRQTQLRRRGRPRLHLAYPGGARGTPVRALAVPRRVVLAEGERLRPCHLRYSAAAAQGGVQYRVHDFSLRCCSLVESGRDGSHRYHQSRAVGKPGHRGRRVVDSAGLPGVPPVCDGGRRESLSGAAGRHLEGA